MSSQPSLRYISREELVEIMRSKKANEDYIIVDVRDDDFIGGNIVGCVRSPSSVFLSDVNGLVEKTKGIPKVVFHCMLSQARGPKSARIYAETSRNLHESEDKPTQEVLILRGGFSEFQAKYKDDPALVEKWRKSLWEAYY